MHCARQIEFHSNIVHDPFQKSDLPFVERDPVLNDLNASLRCLDLHALPPVYSAFVIVDDP